MRLERPTFDLGFVARFLETASDPANNLSPARLKSAIRAFRAGQLSELSLIMEAHQERDYLLAAVVPKAKAAVARHPWEILVVDTRDEQSVALAARQRAVLERFYNNLRVSSVLDQDELGDVSLLIRQMMDAKSKRWAVHNIAWSRKADIDPTATLWFVPLWFCENTTGRMRFAPAGDYAGSRAMKPDEWLVTRGLGIGIASAVTCMLKSYPLEDWAALSSRFGDAMVEGLTDSEKGSPEWNDLVEAVRDLAGGDAIVHSPGSQIKITMPGELGSLPFPALVERMDRALASHKLLEEAQNDEHA